MEARIRDLATRRLQTQPIAIGRTPPSFFSRGMRRAPARWRATDSLAFPSARNVTRRMMAALGFDWTSPEGTRRMSRRCCARRPSGPGAVPLGKLLMSCSSCLGFREKGAVGGRRSGWRVASSSIEGMSSFAGCRAWSFVDVSGSEVSARPLGIRNLKALLRFPA